MTPEQLVDRIALRTPEPPRATIRETLAEVARELCEDGNAWVVDGTVVYNADSDYPVLAAGDGEPVRLLWLELDGHRVEQGEGYTQTAPGELTFHRTPRQSALAGRLAVRPRPGELPPAEVLADHAQTLIDGTLARLLRLPHPWRDLELSADHEQRFLTGVRLARQRSRLGYGRGGARVRARRLI